MANSTTNTPITGRHPDIQRFMFATGFENSYPVIRIKHGRREGQLERRDGLELSGHYERWREDFGLVREMGIDVIRYGPALYKCHLGPGHYDWSFPDQTYAELHKLGIDPITDLCHFGVPDWIGDFQNPEWPEHFAQYAGAFAARFPWVQMYTPVNEIGVCSTFSAQIGWWNERLTSDRAFMTALKHMARANLLAEEAILKVRPDALFVQSESSEYYHQGGPDAEDRATFLNQKRFLSLDLIYGNEVNSAIYEFMMDNGVTRDEYQWFRHHGKAMRPHCVMGNDYYCTNEHKVTGVDGPITPSGEIFGYYVITHQYFDRYRLPVMHTETNLQNAEQAPDWLWKEWHNVFRLKQDGVPIMGFTWFSLIDQTDWDTALREDNRTVNPTGLFDHDRKIRPVGTEYKKLIRLWRDRLPMDSMARVVRRLTAAVPSASDHRVS